MGGRLGALAKPDVAPATSRPSARHGVVVLTPRLAEVTSPPPAVKPRHEPKGGRGAVRSAAYVAYRRRSATGVIHVATGLVAREGREGR